MADYGSRIASLKAEQARLAQRQSELAAQRREEIGRLAERLGVLETEDTVFTGLFLELKAAIASVQRTSRAMARRGPPISVR
jgi:hypothetical protein